MIVAPTTKNGGVLTPIMDIYEVKNKKTHKIYKFSNGWGLSLVQYEGDVPDDERGGNKKDCWNVATIYWTGKHAYEYELDYDNTICNGDVLLDVSEYVIPGILEVVSLWSQHGSTVTTTSYNNRRPWNI